MHNLRLFYLCIHYINNVSCYVSCCLYYQWGACKTSLQPSPSIHGRGLYPWKMNMHLPLCLDPKNLSYLQPPPHTRNSLQLAIPPPHQTKISHDVIICHIGSSRENFPSHHCFVIIMLFDVLNQREINFFTRQFQFFIHSSLILVIRLNKSNKNKSQD